MLRLALYVDTVTMAFGTIRANKMRSALTVLGIVIGITAIVGMTSLIRGFDESVRDMIRQMGPKTIYLAKSGPMVGGNMKQFLEIMKRPNITEADARALKEAPSLAYVDIMFGGGQPGSAQARAFYKNEKTKQMPIVGTTDRYPEVNALTVVAGRYFSGSEVEHRRNVVVLGDTPALALFTGVDPIGKKIRLGPALFTVVGVLGKRLSPGGLDMGADNLALIPTTAYAKTFGLSRFRWGKNTWAPVMIACVPRDEFTREQAMGEIQEIMRARHALKLDQENDFGLITQDSMMSLFDQITQATYLGLVVLSSIALMVGGIGVMSIMMISVTERTREIGVRKALGARRREILWQFLLEAGTLTSVGGVLGIGLGSAVGLLVHYFAHFPISLPVSSFAIGFGFSAAVGMFFGMYPAYKASRLDPIEALRYE
jgi:putative ABC transport system permease protein